MFFLFAFVPLALAALTLASPLYSRQASGPCTGISGGYDSMYNFTLAAFNLTLPNVNSTGAPLVVRFNQWTGSATASYISALSTYYSAHSNNEPTLSLVNGSLIPSNPADADVSSANLAVSASSQLLFEFSTEESELPAPIQNYCIIDSPDSPYPILAVNGVTDAFSLCESDTPYYFGIPNDVMFQATEDNGHTYNYTSCYPVRLQVVYEQA